MVIMEEGNLQTFDDLIHPSSHGIHFGLSYRHMQRRLDMTTLKRVKKNLQPPGARSVGKHVVIPWRRSSIPASLVMHVLRKTKE